MYLFGGTEHPGSDYNISNNIVVKDTNAGARFRVFCPKSGFCGDHNVSDDESARTAFPGASHYVTDWTTEVGGHDLEARLARARRPPPSTNRSVCRSPVVPGSALVADVA